MKKWTKKDLEAAGYTVENAIITDADLGMIHHAALTFSITVDSENGMCCVFGDRKLGTGYLGSEYFDSDERSMVAIMMIMNTVGVRRLSQLKDSYIRVAFKNNQSQGIIGNILKDKWFDSNTFWDEFPKEKEKYWKEYEKKYGTPKESEKNTEKKTVKKRRSRKKKEETLVVDDTSQDMLPQPEYEECNIVDDNDEYFIADNSEGGNE